MLKAYTYAKCDTCRKAVKFLRENQVAFEEVPIRETPPSFAELEAMLKASDGNVRKLFNTSGRDYKALNLSAKLPAMSQKEALDLLTSNGNLVRRPFVIGQNACLTGFDETTWRERLL
ncbi:MAG TPA: Spx/MgsR family RNA polymerase-binding regulatory protein [Chthoniobacterales bacterium]